MITGKRIENEKLVYCDVDDTLIMWDYSKHKEELKDSDAVTITFYDHDSYVYKNQKNINLLIKLAKMNYGIVLWSQTGAEYAEVVARKLGIDEFVTLYMTKPRYHIDDLPSSAWMGTRLWRDPVTGSEE